MHPDNFLYTPAPGKGYVYKITSGAKTYIGISTTPWQRRWIRHCAPDSGCTKLVKLLNKLRETGRWGQLNVEILLSANNKSLDRLLKKYIRKFSSFKGCFGLNSTPGGRDVTPLTMRFDRAIRRAKRKTRQTPKFTWDDI